MKVVKAVAPYIHPEYLNFKTAPYEAWVRNGGLVAQPHYPIRALHGPVFRHELPTLRRDGKEARLRFVEPISLYFDTFPDYAFHEIIPMVWDCWPCYFEKMCVWLKRHKVRTAIFTSSQTADRIQERFPEMNVMWCPEAVDVTQYKKGKELKDRKIDLLEFGRSNGKVFKNPLPSSVRHVCTKVGDTYIYNNEELYEALGDTKLTIALPRSMTQPEMAGDIETLTQRYWENMLSRIVMVGHAPKELVGLIGYNPVVEMDREYFNEQIIDVLTNIEQYQDLVNRNRETALKYGDWEKRMKAVMIFLKENEYDT